MSNPATPLCGHTLRLPRRGYTVDEYEDAAAADAQAARFAIADGATESSFAASWARMLVEEFIRNPGPWTSWLPPLRRRWAAELADRPLPWYAEVKAEEGAYATLLGVWLDPDRRHWHAQAVGDSCLFHVRADRLLRAFPLTRSAAFGNQPALLGSRPRPTHVRPPARHNVQGTWQPGDRLFLMTDALAQWFLVQVEAGRQPWQTLERLHTEADFARWTEEQRDRQELKNDDVTLLTIGTRLPHTAPTPLHASLKKPSPGRSERS